MSKLNNIKIFKPDLFKLLSSLLLFQFCLPAWNMEASLKQSLNDAIHSTDVGQKIHHILVNNEAVLSKLLNHDIILLREILNKGSTPIASLFENNKDLNAPNPTGQTLLHRALLMDFPEIAEQLINKNADVNARDQIGRTPLHIACDKGLAHIVELLINKNADVNATTVFKKTVLQVALDKQHPKIALMLLQHGAHASDETPAQLLDLIPRDPILLGEHPFDAKMEQIITFTGIIFEHRRDGQYSDDSIQKMNEHLKKGQEYFRNKIESGPGIIDPDASLWVKLQDQIEKVVHSKRITIAMVHFMLFKLAVLSDYYQLVDNDSKELFLNASKPGLEIELMERYLKTISGIDCAILIHMDPLECEKNLRTNLSSIIPLIISENEEAEFGLNSFLHAFLNRMCLLVYSPNGCATAHGGYLKNYLCFTSLYRSVPIEYLPTRDRTEFQSSCTFLFHDFLHIAVYQKLFSSRENLILYNQLYAEILGNKSDTWELEVAILFLLIHEWAYNFSSGSLRSFGIDSRTADEIFSHYSNKNRWLEVQLDSFLTPYSNLKSSMNPAYSQSHPEEFTMRIKARGIFEFHDIGTLLETYGMELKLNKAEPWTWGPAILEGLIHFLHNNNIGKKILTKSEIFSVR